MSKHIGKVLDSQSQNRLILKPPSLINLNFDGSRIRPSPSISR